VEFSFFFLTHATLVGLTHVDAEAHRAPRIDLEAMIADIRAATPDRVVLSSDCGVALLPPPIRPRARMASATRRSTSAFTAVSPCTRAARRPSARISAAVRSAAGRSCR
jgi:hypothetical protein